MNGSAVSRQNGDGTADRLAVRLTRRAPGSNEERSPYKTVWRRATALAAFNARLNGRAHENDRGHDPEPADFPHEVRGCRASAEQRPPCTCLHTLFRVPGR
ncbi:hypothetical protein DF047_03625 [Burkholderia cenocepacia]|nr:hypothetical protein DF047_03625 [Burkholderia cenocepacia]